MANLFYYDGNWFSSDAELQEYLEQRFIKRCQEDYYDDYDWLDER